MFGGWRWAEALNVLGFCRVDMAEASLQKPVAHQCPASRDECLLPLQLALIPAFAPQPGRASFLEDTHWAPSLSPLQGPESQPCSQHRKGTGGWIVEMAQLEAMALQNKVIWKVTDAVSFIWASQSYLDIQVLSYLVGFPSGSKVIVF